MGLEEHSVDLYVSKNPDICYEGGLCLIALMEVVITDKVERENTPICRLSLNKMKSVRLLSC